MSDPEGGGLRVAITGATGEVGAPLLTLLASSSQVASVQAMARHPPGQPSADPKVTFHAGDVCDPSALDALLADSAVLIHLAFSLFGSRREMARTNLQAPAQLVEAAKRAGVRRLVYASSVAVYGFDHAHDRPLREDAAIDPSRGDRYASHKVQAERLLSAAASGSELACYFLRAPIVAGPRSLALVATNPHVRIAARMPPVWARRYLNGQLGPLLMPDTGVRWQLVHADDLAQAFLAATSSDAPPGAYNVAGPGDIGQRDLADALGWRTVRVPRGAAQAAAGTVKSWPGSSARSRFMANMLQQAIPVDSAKAHDQLDWRPAKDSITTLRETVAAARAAQLV